MHRKLMDCPSDAQKFDKSCQNVHTVIRPSINFLCVRRIFRQLPSNFCVRATICQFSVRQQDLPSTTVNLPCGRGTFRKLSMRPWEHPSNIHAAAGFPSTFVNFMSISETFRQLSIRPRNLPSTFCLSVENFLFGSWTFRLTSHNFLCGCVTFRQLSVHLRYHPSSFSASAGYSDNFSCY